MRKRKRPIMNALEFFVLSSAVALLSFTEADNSVKGNSVAFLEKGLGINATEHDAQHNLASYASLTASSTCGTPAAKYCKLSGTGLDKGLDCDICDDLVQNKSHPITNVVIGGKSTWWQSENGKQYVNVTIDLGQVFYVSSIYLRMGPSPRPRQWIVQKSVDGEQFYEWKFFAADNESCIRDFNVSSSNKPKSEDDVLCDTKQSARVTPLEYGEVIINLVENRFFGLNFSENDALQKWLEARFIRLNFRKWHSLGGELFTSLEKSFHDQLYYTLSEISVYGQCICQQSEWSLGCFKRNNSTKFLCLCTDNTCGDNCDECCPGFYKVYQSHKRFKCETCECNGHSSKCIVRTVNQQEEVWCHECKNNTKGRHCENCLDNSFYRFSPKLDKEVNLQLPCKSCDCNKQGSRSLSCDRQGQCLCHPFVEGLKCDQCSPGYWKFPLCKKCHCSILGSNNSCDQISGQCSCKENFTGQGCYACIDGMQLIDGNCEECSECQEFMLREMRDISKELSYLIPDVCFFIADYTKFTGQFSHGAFLQCIKLTEKPLKAGKDIEYQINTIWNDSNDYYYLLKKANKIEVLADRIHQVDFTAQRLATKYEMEAASAILERLKNIFKPHYHKTRELHHKLKNLEWELDSSLSYLNYTNKLFLNIKKRQQILKTTFSNISSLDITNKLKMAKNLTDNSKTYIKESNEHFQAISNTLQKIKDRLTQWFHPYITEYEVQNNPKSVCNLPLINTFHSEAILETPPVLNIVTLPKINSEKISSRLPRPKTVPKINFHDITLTKTESFLVENKYTDNISSIEINASKKTQHHNVDSLDMINDKNLANCFSIKNIYSKTNETRNTLKKSKRKIQEIQTALQQSQLQLNKILDESISKMKLPEKGLTLLNLHNKIVELKQKLKMAIELIKKIKVPFLLNSVYLIFRNDTKLFMELKSFEMKLCSSKPNGIILANPEAQNGTHIAIWLKEWRIHLKVCFGGLCNISSTQSYLAKDQWFNILFKAEDQFWLNVTYNDGWTEIIEIISPAMENKLPLIDPLYVGGFPNLTEEDDYFFGCIDSLNVNEVPIDLITLETGRGTLRFCFETKTNSTLAEVITMNGNGYHKMLLSNAHFLPFSFEFSFRTYQKDATLMFLCGDEQSVIIHMKNGQITFYHQQVNDDPMMGKSQRKTYNDGKWHTVQIQRISNMWFLIVDQRDRDSFATTYWEINQDLKELRIGGTDITRDHFMGTNLIGCLKNIILNDIKFPFQKIQESSDALFGLCVLPTDYCACIVNETLSIISLPPFISRIAFDFKTNSSSPSILIFRISSTSYAHVYQERGKVNIRVEKRNMAGRQIFPTGPKINDGQWHSLALNFHDHKIYLIVDGFQTEIKKMLDVSRFSTQRQMILGSLNSKTDMCYNKLFINEKQINFSDIATDAPLKTC